MSINITGVHISVTEALEKQVMKRINRLSKRYPLIAANVTFSQEHDDFTCKIDYKGENQEAQAQGTDKDLYKAISTSSDRLERQLNDQKEGAKKKGRETIRTPQDLSDLTEDDVIYPYEEDSLS